MEGVVTETEPRLKYVDGVGSPRTDSCDMVLYRGLAGESAAL